MVLAVPRFESRASCNTSLIKAHARAGKSPRNSAWTHVAEIACRNTSCKRCHSAVQSGHTLPYRPSEPPSTTRPARGNPCVRRWRHTAPAERQTPAAACPPATAQYSRLEVVRRTPISRTSSHRHSNFRKKDSATLSAVRCRLSATRPTLVVLQPAGDCKCRVHLPVLPFGQRGGLDRQGIRPRAPG